MPKPLNASLWPRNLVSKNAPDAGRHSRPLRQRFWTPMSSSITSPAPVAPECMSTTLGTLRRAGTGRVHLGPRAEQCSPSRHDLEAVDRFGWPVNGIAEHPQRHPEQFRQLTRFREAVDEIPAFGIQVLPITAGLVSAAAALSQQYGLLSGDALVVAVMASTALCIWPAAMPISTACPG